MGGVRTDVHGRTSLPRLYAAGEVACTGVHGANRLASNSLLEGLVFGARAAEAMAGETALAKSGSPYPKQVPRHEEKDFSGPRTELQQLMWSKAGLLRDAEGLRAAAAEFPRLSRVWRGAYLTRVSVEYQNLHHVSRLIVQAALAREESRGAHYRNDFPHRDDKGFARHSVLQREGKLQRSIWRLEEIDSPSLTSAAI
jgi:L-aspartate oxidase